MKKHLLAVVILALATSVGLAGNSFNKGNSYGHVGLGIGLAGLYGTSSLPPITVSYERAIEQKIGIGGIFGYSSSKQDPFANFSWKYTYIIIGARGAYHFLEDNENTDAYGGATLGYNIVSVKEEYTGPGTKPFGFSASGSYGFFGAFLGGRYFFSPKVGVYAEAGYGIGYINAGICFRL